MQKITPHLWYSHEAEEAAAFYVSIFPNSRVKRVTPLLSDSPSGPPGSVKVVEFELFGQDFMAITAGPLDSFNHAVSFIVNCDDQAEIDRYWDRLTADGGEPGRCGWCKDRYGLSWQVVPAGLGELVRDDAARQALFGMDKIDIAALRAAAEGAAV